MFMLTLTAAAAKKGDKNGCFGMPIAQNPRWRKRDGKYRSLSRKLHKIFTTYLYECVVTSLSYAETEKIRSLARGWGVFLTRP
jgi:hypothetical protein